MSDHDAIMARLQEIFAPPTSESLGKKGLAGIPSARRSKKQSGSRSTSGSSASKVVDASKDDPSWRKPRPNCHDYCDSCNCTEGDRLVCDRCPASFHLECLDPPMDPQNAPTGIWYCHRCTMLAKLEEEEADDVSSGSSNAGVSNKKSSLSEDKCSKLSPYRSLMEIYNHWRLQNPKEFSLPKELIPAIKIPGSYKTPAERKANPIIELENGMIPKPVRRCYNCAKTCMLAPLLPCDYCTACFHLECLDPPLAQFPPRSDRWMCPLHAEHTVDKCLVRTIRLSDRIRAWNQLAIFDPDVPLDAIPAVNDVLDGASHAVQYTPEDERAVLSAFLKRVARRKLEAGAAQEVLRESMRTYSNPLVPRPIRQFSCAPIKVPDAVKALYRNPVRRLPRFNEVFRGNSKSQPGTASQSLTLGDQSQHSVRATKEEQNLFVRGLLEFYIREPEEQSIRSGTSEVNPAKTSGGIDSETSSIASDSASPSQPQPSHSSKNNFAMPLSLRDKLRDVLRELDNHISRDKKNVPKELVECEGKILSTLVDTHITVMSSDRPRLPCRAALIPCTGTNGPTVVMSSRNLTIGTGPDCQLRLSNYYVNSQPPCPKVSSLHAILFYDSYSRQFELLNYSEFGSFVDCIPFKNDNSEKTTNQTEASRPLNHVRRLVEDVENSDCTVPKRPKLNPPNLDAQHICTDDDSTATEFGWEGSAVLHHGSVLRFGCYIFTFSIVEWFSLSKES
ncbi:hypothetical protein Aperf_G00000032367 [Anoplocephala perfoliata]